jgi:hypothetical protein
MSYILDALKKSKEIRQKSSTRPIGSGLTFVKHTPPPRKKFVFGLILTSFMLLAAIILGGGWWWSQQDQAKPAAKKEEKASVSTVDNDAVQQEREVSSVPAQQEVAPPVADNSTRLGPPSQSSNEIPYLADE